MKQPHWHTTLIIGLTLAVIVVPLLMLTRCGPFAPDVEPTPLPTFTVSPAIATPLSTAAPTVTAFISVPTVAATRTPAYRSPTPTPLLPTATAVPPTATPDVIPVVVPVFAPPTLEPGRHVVVPAQIPGGP